MTRSEGSRALSLGPLGTSPWIPRSFAPNEQVAADVPPEIAEVIMGMITSDTTAHAGSAGPFDDDQVVELVASMRMRPPSEVDNRAAMMRLKYPLLA